MYDLLQAAVGKIDVLSNNFNNMDKKLDLHIQKTDYRFEKIEALDKQQNDILEKHHQRSDQLKKDNELRESALNIRIEALEAPRKWIDNTKSLLIWLASVAGAVGVLMKFLHH